MSLGAISCNKRSRVSQARTGGTGSRFSPVEFRARAPLPRAIHDTIIAPPPSALRVAICGISVRIYRAGLPVTAARKIRARQIATGEAAVSRRRRARIRCVGIRATYARYTVRGLRAGPWGN